MECADKGNTDHKERAIDVPNGKTHSVFLRKYWAAGREAKEVVGCWIGFTLEGLPCYVQAMTERRSGFWFGKELAFLLG